MYNDRVVLLVLQVPVRAMTMLCRTLCGYRYVQRPCCASRCAGTGTYNDRVVGLDVVQVPARAMTVLC